MGGLIEFAVGTVADFFGYAMGHNRPWWVRFVTSLGCVVILGITILLLWLLVR